MGKATIIEAQTSSTEFENTNNSGILGKLKGVFADYKHGTRNADRLYTEELWDNRVFGSEDVMEALETKTLFGELDHPDGDRCETLAKNAAITITKLEKRPEEGVIYGEAEILDTPTGRIVKALADSGAKLGISSRGMGEEIISEGKNIIDPETYDFITFDVVVTPANTKARVSLTESKHASKLVESLSKEIDDCETENQLNQIKTVVDTIAIENKDTITDKIEEKLNKFMDNKTVKVNKFIEANRPIAIRLLNDKVSKLNEQLQESLNANKELSEENTKLVEEKEYLKSSKSLLQGKLKESKSLFNSLNAKFEQSNEMLDDLNKAMTEKENELTGKLQENKEVLKNVKKINEMKVEKLQQEYEEKVKQLEESNSNLQQQINTLTEENTKLTESVKDKSKILTDNKKLQEQVNLLLAEKEQNAKKLTESKNIEQAKINELKAQVRKLQEANVKAMEAQERLSSVSFNSVVASGRFTGDTNNNYSEEDEALYNILTQ